MSNSRYVLAQLPPKDILSSPGTSQPFDLGLDSLPVERALGVLWDVEQDTLEIKVVPKSSEKGILRVGGRLKHAPIPYQAKHPAILPKKHDIVPLILLHLHQRLNHSGVEHILAELRQQYWIPKVRSALKKIAKSCHVCRKHNAKPDPPLMASLPQSRNQAFTPPFYNTGVDYFGPLLVKERRSTVKRYGCLFTCLVKRAVHLEIAHSLETDSFIMALRRMMVRRGKLRNIYSDNGTNFVRAERELKECLDGMDQAKISDTLSQDRIQWFFNPPSAPHFGGPGRDLLNQQRSSEEHPEWPTGE